MKFPLRRRGSERGAPDLSSAEHPRGVGPRWALALLTGAVVVSYLDRYVLAILIQPIKRELLLSDTQIGWLVGFAFSLIYAFFGIPVAHIADKGRRRNVVVASLVIWSAMTALCGAVHTFSQLFAARVGVPSFLVQ